MNQLLSEEIFAYLSKKDKEFILSFNDEMSRLGYDYGGKIGPGYCWGRHMVIYTKTGVKSKKVYARIYMRDESILLRLFLNDIDQHRGFIESAPAHIKEVFTGDSAKCNHCRDDKEEDCMFRKTYTIDGRLYEKCSGVAFEIPNPRIELMKDYMGLFAEFYAPKRAIKTA